MMYIRQKDIEAAFVMMINKLVFSQKQILKPLLMALRGTNDKERLRHVQVLEEQIDKTLEQQKVITDLMQSGYLEHAVYAQENGDLQANLKSLQTEKTKLSQSINGSFAQVAEVQKLLRFTSHIKGLDEFDEDIFLDFVDEIWVLSRDEIEFHLKCGLNLKERLVNV